MRRAQLFGLGIVLMGLPVFAIAQQATATPEQPAPVSSGGAVQNLSPKEQLAAGNSTLDRMKGTATAIRRQLEQARREKDVVKVLCLDDKLSQADVAVRSGEEHRTSLEAAAAKNDAEAASHESGVLAVLSDRSAQVAVEASQCIGEESAFTNNDQAITKIDPNISRSENGGLPGPTAGDIVIPPDPPQCTSCSR